MSDQKTKHPASFSRSVLDALDKLVPPGLYLDPFAGIGKIFRLQNDQRYFVAVELEKEWADVEPETLHGDSLFVMSGWQMDGTRFDGVVTSPVYGNRMSDHHNAKDGSSRRSYTHDLQTMTGDPDRKLSEGNSGTMYFWSEEYKVFHLLAWKLAFEITRPGGMMFLNVSNFIRTKRGRNKAQGTYRTQEIQYVVPWHMKALGSVGYEIITLEQVETPRMKHGENRERVSAEHIIIARRPGGDQ